MRFETIARTHIGCRRKINEDAMLVRPDPGLWAVADGMGGHEAGEVASALVVEILGQVAGRDPDTRAAHARAALAEANRTALAHGARRVGRTIGSTIVAMAADGAFLCLGRATAAPIWRATEDFASSPTITAWCSNWWMPAIWIPRAGGRPSQRQYHHPRRGHSAGA